MGRSPCCDNAHISKGSWTKDEDQRLIDYIRDHGVGCWRSLPKAAGLLRCGKSCRLRWLNYLRPGLKRGNFSKEDDAIIIKLHSLLGNKWSVIAQRLPGRTDNEIKNHWNSHIKRELISHGIDPLHTRRKINATDPAVAAVATTNKENTTNKVHSSICLDFQKTTALSPFTLNNQNDYMKAKDLCYEDTGCSSGTTMETEAPQKIKKMVDPKDLNLELSIGHPIQTKSSPFSGLLQMFPATAKPAVEKQGLCLCWQLGFQNDQLCLKCQMRTGYYNKTLCS